MAQRDPVRAIGLQRAIERMVGQGRFELPTSRLSSARSNQLSYWPLSPMPVQGLWQASVLRTWKGCEDGGPEEPGNACSYEEFPERLSLPKAAPGSLERR
jgi:hypothetical protein